MTKRRDLPEDAKEEFPTLSPSEMTDRSWESLGRIAEAERRDEPAPDNLSASDPLRAVGTLSSPAEDDEESEEGGEQAGEQAAKDAGVRAGPRDDEG
jgi:hypothetical protein